MLITRSQGAACRRAAERIARTGSIDDWLKDSDRPDDDALLAIGWCKFGEHNRFSDCLFDKPYSQSQVLMALLWCAEIAGE